ncbi:MAG: GntR family transcriptional regulator [Victivallaceae bacterium]|nr:GntR family transcriptional regulator [Victivallaceae bacterium]
MTLPQKALKLRLQVAQLLHQLIEDDSFKVGSRLPSERKLVEQFKVSRSSIREAIRALEAVGILESRRGAGNIVLSKQANVITHSHVITEETEAKEIMEILEMRRGLELEAVRLATERITMEQEKTLQCYIGEMRIANCEAVAQAIETGFHQQIVEYSGNRLLQRYFTSIMQMTQGLDVFGVCSHSQLMLEVHAELCESIVERLPDAAEAALKHYFAILIDAQR